MRGNARVTSEDRKDEEGSFIPLRLFVCEKAACTHRRVFHIILLLSGIILDSPLLVASGRFRFLFLFFLFHALFFLLDITRSGVTISSIIVTCPSSFTIVFVLIRSTTVVRSSTSTNCRK